MGLPKRKLPSSSPWFARWRRAMSKEPRIDANTRQLKKASGFLASVCVHSRPLAAAAGWRVVSR
jgi:hypothetical protein